MDRFHLMEADMFRSADEDIQLWEPGPPEKLLPLGRILSTLLGADPRDLQKALNKKSGKPQHGALGKAVSALLQHVKILLLQEYSLDLVSVPLLEQVVKSKDRISHKPGFVLLQLLIESEDLGLAVAEHLVVLIQRDDVDNRVKLGWCLAVRKLIQCGSVCYKSLNKGQALQGCRSDQDSMFLFSACIPQLVKIVIEASLKDAKRRVPTRLASAAADCVLVITKGLATGPESPENSLEENSAQGQPRVKSLITPVNSSFSDEGRKMNLLDVEEQATSSGRQADDKIRSSKWALWDYLDSLVLLVAELQEWNVVLRPLHMAALQQVRKRLQLLAQFRDSLKVQSGDIEVGINVLAACWQQYSSFMIFEDKNLAHNPQSAVEQWMDALQHFSQEQTGDGQEQELSADEIRRAEDMRRYALTCLALLLGRLGTQQLDSVVEELEPRLLKLLLGQLQCRDDDTIDLAVAILRALLFRSPSAMLHNTLSISRVQRIEAFIPSLMDMLEERDSAARAVVLLVAEFFAANPGSPEFEQLFKRLDSADPVQRRNALDVLSELISISTRAADVADSILSQSIAKHLLRRLADEELTNRVEASALYAKLDPRFVLPALVNSVYSLDGRVRSSASSAISTLMKSHSNQIHIISMLLDSITNLPENISSPTTSGEVDPTSLRTTEKVSKSHVDVDRIMNLVPNWAAAIQDYDPLIKLVLDKMVAEPSNPVLPRFLSQISSFILDKGHIIFPHVLTVMCQQQISERDPLVLAGKAPSSEGDGGVIFRELFQRLSPLLVLKVLPLKMLSDKNDKHVYGNLLATGSDKADQLKANQMPEEEPCIAGLLVQRMCLNTEYRDVRKLACEVTSHLLPDFVVPLVTALLKESVIVQNLVTVKSCLYVLCNLFAIRGEELLSYSEVSTICSSLVSILLWPSTDEEITKAQHGCIDCFAMMIVAELSPAKKTSERNMSLTVSAPQSKPEVTSAPILIDEGSRRPKLMEEFSDRPMVIKEVVDRHWLIQEVSDEPRHNEEPVDTQTAFETVTGSTLFKGKIWSTIISSLSGQTKQVPFMSGHLQIGQAHGKLVSEEPAMAPIHLRLCMANSLISACQKIPKSSSQTFATAVIPPVMLCVKDCNEAVIKAACWQVLFSVVFHLKSPAVIPYCCDLLNLATAVVRGRDPSEVRICALKLITVLLASDDAILNEVAAYLMDVQSVLESVAQMDTSSEMRNLCEKLFTFMTSPSVNSL